MTNSMELRGLRLPSNYVEVSDNENEMEYLEGVGKWALISWDVISRRE